MIFDSARQARPQGNLQELGKLAVTLSNLSQELLERHPTINAGRHGGAEGYLVFGIVFAQGARAQVQRATRRIQQIAVAVELATTSGQHWVRFGKLLNAGAECRGTKRTLTLIIHRAGKVAGEIKRLSRSLNLPAGAIPLQPRIPAVVVEHFAFHLTSEYLSHAVLRTELQQ